MSLLNRKGSKDRKSYADLLSEMESVAPKAPVADVPDTLLQDARGYDDPTPAVFYGEDVLNPTQEPTPEEAGRMGQQFAEGGKDVGRNLAIGTELLFQLGEESKNWEAKEMQEGQMPFSTYRAADKTAFGDFLTKNKIDLNTLDPQISKDLRINFVKNRDKDQMNWVKSSSDKLQSLIEADPTLMQNQTFLEKLVRTTPQVLGQVAISLASGGTMSVPFMGLQIVGSSYANSMAEGATHENASRMAIFNAMLQTPLEQIGIGKATKLWKAKKEVIKRIKKLAEGGFTEGLTEAIQEFPDAWTNLMAKNPDKGMLKAFGEVVKNPETWTNAVESGAIGAILGTGVTAATMPKGQQQQEVTDEVTPEATVDPMGEYRQALVDRGFDPKMVAEMQDQDIIASVEQSAAVEPAPVYEKGGGLADVAGVTAEMKPQEYAQFRPTEGAQPAVPYTGTDIVPVQDQVVAHPEVAQRMQEALADETMIAEAAKFAKTQKRKAKGVAKAKDIASDKIVKQFEKRSAPEKQALLDKAKKASTDKDMMNLIKDIASVEKVQAEPLKTKEIELKREPVVAKKKVDKKEPVVTKKQSSVRDKLTPQEIQKVKAKGHKISAIAKMTPVEARKILAEKPPEAQTKEISKESIAKVDPVGVRFRGKLYRGQVHALVKADIAEELGIDIAVVGKQSKDGFVTESGKFVNRESAAQIAKASKQLEDRSTMAELEGELDSQDLKGSKTAVQVRKERKAKAEKVVAKPAPVVEKKAEKRAPVRKIIREVKKEVKVKRTAIPYHALGDKAKPVSELTEMQRRTEIRALKQHVDNAEALKRLKEVVEWHVQEKEQPGGVSKTKAKQAKTEAEENAVIAKATEKEWKKALKVSEKSIGRANALASASKLGYSGDELVSAVLPKILHYQMTKGKNPTATDVQGWMKNYLQTDTFITQPRQAEGGPVAKVARMGSEEQLSVAAKDTAETGARTSQKAADNQFVVEDIETSGELVEAKEAAKAKQKADAVPAKAKDLTFKQRVTALSKKIKDTIIKVNAAEEGYVDVYRDSKLIKESVAIEDMESNVDEIIKRETKKPEPEKVPTKVKEDKGSGKKKIAEGPVLAEQASKELGTEVRYDFTMEQSSGDDWHGFSITSGAHEGASFTVISKEPLASDVEAAADKMMSDRERMAKSKGTIPTPVKDRIKATEAGIEAAKKEGIPVKVLEDKLAEMKENKPKKPDFDKLGKGDAGEWYATKTPEDVEKINKLEKLDNDPAAVSKEEAKKIDAVDTVIDTGKAAFGKVSKAGNKLAKALDVESWFGQEEKDLALAVKNKKGDQASEQMKALEIAEHVEQIARGQEMTKAEQQEALIAYENDDDWNALSAEKKAKYKPVVKFLKNYFGTMQTKLGDIGQNVAFVKHSLKQLQKDYEAAKKQKDRDNIREKMEVLKQMHFAGIPTALLYVKLSRRSKHGSTKSQKAHKGLMDFMEEMSRNRETLSIKSLLERKEWKNADVNITPTEVVGMYGNRAAKDFALSKVIKEMAKHGMIVKRDKVGKSIPGGFRAVSAYKYPSLQNYYVANRGVEILDNLIDMETNTNWYDRANSKVKGLQFFNPIFMPMYDVLQGAKSGAWDVGTFKSFKNSVNDVRHKSDAYLEAQSLGLFSKPFELFTDDFMMALRKITSENRIPGLSTITEAADIRGRSTAGKVVKGAEQALMGASWTMAWEMDNMIRMTTYKQLLKRGMSKADAAQTAAKFHGDYASVPPKTRKWLNRIMFTPTFKIVMQKMYLQSMKAAVKTATKTITGNYKDLTKVDKAMALNGLTILATGAAFHAVMKGMGFDLEDEDWFNYGRSYVHKDSPEKRWVFSTPHNIWNRYLGKIAKAYRATNGDVFSAEFAQRVGKSDMAIAPKILIDLFTNRKFDGSPVYDEFDSRSLKNIKAATYGLTQSVAILNAMIRATNLVLDTKQLTTKSSYAIQRREQLNQYHKSLGTFLEILSPAYMGYKTPEVQKIGMQIQRNANLLKKELKKAIAQGMEVREPWMKEWQRRHDILKDRLEAAREREYNR